MTGLGLTHLALMIGALGLGLRVFLRPKGTPAHKRSGRLFIAIMMVSNLVVFGIREDSEQLGIFHLLAITSLLSLAGAVALVRLPGAGTGRRIAHGHVMLWSYGGVVAAGFGQGATIVGTSPWPAIAMTFLVVALIAFRTDFAGMLNQRHSSSQRP